MGIYEGFILFPITELSQAPSVFEVKKKKKKITFATASFDSSCSIGRVHHASVPCCSTILMTSVIVSLG